MARLRPIAGPGIRVVVIATSPQKSTGEKSSPPDAMFSGYTVRKTMRYRWIVSYWRKWIFACIKAVAFLSWKTPWETIQEGGIWRVICSNETTLSISARETAVLMFANWSYLPICSSISASQSTSNPASHNIHLPFKFKFKKSIEGLRF